MFSESEREEKRVPQSKCAEVPETKQRAKPARQTQAGFAIDVA